jgi:hypothetical protein
MMPNKLEKVDADNISLHLTDNSPAFCRGLKFSAIFRHSGFINDNQCPLIVSIPAQNSGIPAAVSCRSFLDAIANELKYFFTFEYRNKNPTIGHVLYAKCRSPGQ